MTALFRRSGLAAGFALAVVFGADAQEPPVSLHGALPEGVDCAACHTVQGWTPTRTPMQFRHGVVSGFELTGAHAQATCRSCHEELRFDGPEVAPTECTSCHVDVHEGRMLQDCASCHTTVSFAAVDGDRIHMRTSFPLTGSHQQLGCESCHVDDRGGAFSTLPTDCASCHMPDYSSARTVDHVAAGYPTSCMSCHGTVAWGDALFDHVTVSNGFELIGAHGRVACASCHTVPGLALRFTAASSQDCVACHVSDYQEEHAGSDFPVTCLTCHGTESWGGARFEHASTRFPLLGAHQTVSCASCHSASGGPPPSQLPASPEDCVSCHRVDYESEHAGTSFPTTCLTCHTASTWGGARVDHVALPGGFELVGAHVSAACTSCHSVPGYALLFPEPANTQDCVSCHRTEYDQRHAGTAFPTTCLTCHTASTWSGASVDHVALSGGFELVGAHVSAACTSCHAVPGYALLFPDPANTQDCVSCHRGEYDQRHAATGFPTTCLTCHTVSTWTGATVDHAALARGFQLLGAHAAAACADCHSLPGYELRFPTPASQADCVACHRPDFDGAHAGSGYPTTCSTCHTVSSWASTFNHDAQFFRIDSGPHREKWTSCSNCHTAPSSFAVFTCLTCHEHRQTAMDEKHRERQGYQYESNACYSCHRNEL